MSVVFTQKEQVRESGFKLKLKFMISSLYSVLMEGRLFGLSVKLTIRDKTIMRIIVF